MNKRTLTKVKKALEGIKNEDFGMRMDHEEPDLVSPTVFERDGMLHVSAEDGHRFVDYYGEFRGGYPYIDPRLEEVAKTHGCYWEWCNPGSICLVD